MERTEVEQGEQSRETTYVSDGRLLVVVYQLVERVTVRDLHGNVVGQWEEATGDLRERSATGPPSP